MTPRPKQLVREIAVDLETNVVTDDGHEVGLLHLSIEEGLHRLARVHELIEETGRIARLVEKEDEVAVFADALDLKRGLLLALVEEATVGEVVDRVDGLLDAVLFHDEIIRAEPEDVIALAIGDDDVEDDGVDVDLLPELRRLDQHLFLSERRKSQYGKRKNDDEAFHGCCSYRCSQRGASGCDSGVHNNVIGGTESRRGITNRHRAANPKGLGDRQFGVR